MADEIKEMTPEQEALVAKHIGLIAEAARNVRRDNKDMTVRELQGIGWLALVTVAHRFDPQRGEFGTYAKKRLRGAMLDELRKERGGPLYRAFVSSGVGAPRPVKEARVSSDGAREAVDLEMLIDPTTTMSTKYVKAQMKRAALEIVDDLEPEKRDLVRAIYIEEISQAAYAKRSGKGLSTIKRHLKEVMPLLFARLSRGNDK